MSRDLDGDTRRALWLLALGVSEGWISEADATEDLEQLCGSRGDLRAYFRRQLEIQREALREGGDTE